MSIKFTDDIGISEVAVDEGGPRREFLQLIMDYLSTCPMFAGCDTAKHLNLLHAGINCYVGSSDKNCYKVVIIDNTLIVSVIVMFKVLFEFLALQYVTQAID